MISVMVREYHLFIYLFNNSQVLFSQLSTAYTTTPRHQTLPEYSALKSVVLHTLRILLCLCVANNNNKKRYFFFFF